MVLAGEWAGKPSPELLGPKDILDKRIISHSLESSLRYSDVSSSPYPYGQPFLGSSTLTNAGTVTGLLTTD